MSEGDELARLRQENQLLNEALDQAGVEALRLAGELAAMEEVLRTVLGQLRATVDAWRRGEDVGPFLAVLAQAVNRAERKAN